MDKLRKLTPLRPLGKLDEGTVSELEQLTTKRNLLLHDRALLIADQHKIDAKLVTQNENIADIVADMALIEADNLKRERSL